MASTISHFRICQCITDSCYTKRLLTYANFPAHSFQDPKNHSRAGFIYTGTLDIVYCGWCNIKIGGWLLQDCPFLEHLRLSPICKYLSKHVISQDTIDSTKKSAII